MQVTLKFSETSPATASTAASSAAVAGSSGAAGIASSSPVDLDSFTSLSVHAQLVGATGGTLDVYLQTSHDFGTTWVDYAHFTQLAAGGAAVKYTFAASQGGQQLTPTTHGVGTTPALAANTVVGGAWGDRFRLVMVAGVSTTAGAAVVVHLSFKKPN